MKRIFVMFLLLFAGCGMVKFNIKEKPNGISKEQQTIDDLQCSKDSEHNGPWLFGIGTLIYREMAKSDYQDCMTSKGYVVEPK